MSERYVCIMPTQPLIQAPDAETCVPNFANSGRRRRLWIGSVAAVATAAGLIACVATQATGWWRLVLFLPAATAGTSLLQLRRNTCVSRAASGLIEHEDGSTTTAPAAQAEVSRRVAATIRRDGMLIGIAVTALALALSRV